MIISSGSVKINFEHLNQFDPAKKTVLLFHGFTGSLEDWRSVSTSLDKSFNYVGIDLIGHGKSESPDELAKYGAEEIVNQIDGIVSHLNLHKINLLGYSMGGRAALNYTVKFPGKVEALILESTSAGIKDQKDLQARIKSDEKLAKYVEKHSIEEFIELWLNLDIFNTQRRFSEYTRRQIKFAKMQNNKIGLANSLRGFGTGKMTPLLNGLRNVSCKTLLITGELDTKFTNINNEIVNLYPNAEHKIIKNAGHNTHLEELEKFVNLVNKFLSNI